MERLIEKKRESETCPRCGIRAVHLYEVEIEGQKRTACRLCKKEINEGGEPWNP